MTAITLLHLETATKVCSVALSVNGELVSLREVKDDDYVHAEKLTILIEEVLQEVGLKASDLSAVSVTSGPGSYTGLRIGVSTAKGLCYALSIPLIGLDTLFVLAQVAKTRYPEYTLCPLIDARRMEVYNAIYDHQLTPLKPISADILDATSYQEFEPFVCFGDGAAKIKDLWEGRSIVVDETMVCSASGHIVPAYERFCAQQFEDVAYFEPYYLKDFVVVSKGQKKENKS